MNAMEWSASGFEPAMEFEVVVSAKRDDIPEVLLRDVCVVDVVELVVMIATDEAMRWKFSFAIPLVECNPSGAGKIVIVTLVPA